MENLNAEQIIENLERSIRLSMEFHSEFPVITYSKLRDAIALIKSQEQRIGAQDMTISELRQRAEKAEHDADRYAKKIKELTEENERLRVDNNLLKMPRATIFFEIADAFKRGQMKVKADTVRKMQEALEQRIHSKLSYHGWYLKETVIAEIVNELLEGSDET